MLSHILNQRLHDYRRADLYRTRRILTTPQSVLVICDGKSQVSFCSNDYLSLANHPDVIQAFKKGVEKYGAGSGASQLVSGYNEAHQALEEAFAKFLKRDRALLFSSGYLANLGVLHALMRQEDGIFQDKFNHASLIDAGRLSSACLQRYAHGDIEHLKLLLHKHTKKFNQKLIVTDGVFSMNGSIAFLDRLTEQAKLHDAWLMVDDAHGIGVLGATGGGSVEHFNLSQHEVPVLICPLGKAFGCCGAIVSGSEILIENLIQFARTFIYTTALPSAVACAALASLKIIQQENFRREKLNYLIRYFKQAASRRNLNFQQSDTAIQVFIIGDAARTVQMSEKLFARGYLIAAMRSPSVKKNQACLRMTLNYLHEEKHIDGLLNNLAEIYAASY